LAYCLAEYHLAHDDFEPALEAAHKLVELEDLPWNRIYQASMLIRHGSPQTLQTALSLLTRLFDQSPESVSTKVKLIEAYIALDDAAQAKAPAANDSSRRSPAGYRNITGVGIASRG